MEVKISSVQNLFWNFCLRKVKMKLLSIFFLSALAYSNPLTIFSWNRELIRKHFRPQRQTFPKNHAISIDELVRAIEKTAAQREKFNRMMDAADKYIQM